MFKQLECNLIQNLLGFLLLFVSYINYRRQDSPYYSNALERTLLFRDEVLLDAPNVQ